MPSLTPQNKSDETVWMAMKEGFASGGLIMIPSALAGKYHHLSRLYPFVISIYYLSLLCSGKSVRGHEFQSKVRQGEISHASNNSLINVLFFYTDESIHLAHLTQTVHQLVLTDRTRNHATSLCIRTRCREQAGASHA